MDLLRFTVVVLQFPFFIRSMQASQIPFAITFAKILRFNNARCELMRIDEITLKKLFPFDLSGKLCIEINFEVIGDSNYTYCWMEKLRM